MAVEKVRPIDRFLEIVYSFAAVPVLLGALFKITHTAPFGSANGWLNFGLYTEAFVFMSFGLLYIFAPPKAVDEMGIPIGDDVKFGKSGGQAAQPSALAAVDNMLKDADITPDSMNRLSDGFKNLEASIQRISTASNSMANTEEYMQKLQEATASLTSMNSFYAKLAETSQALVTSADDAKKTQAQIGQLAENLAKLNQVYGGMLSAMQGQK
ncbi:gliding motility protein GldL [Arachidicoccus ginsenosidivorans]|jgi:hypothetical protein|uniref:Gliding motility protein GldL-like N-terminal domain-containing protein n=1 Tax=Arachidicoccus ginsenosidivorans TaxID=496057 RepID=A0A5B8VIF3_9BACT|nr:hypothetical protein [Arachidicoccus ginsenosidivorans]QEC71367.1 hypothetical protein FSB73_06460 [Arachidicoccus ginsenosidivorans]